MNKPAVPRTVCHAVLCQKSPASQAVAQGLEGVQAPCRGHEKGSIIPLFVPVSLRDDAPVFASHEHCRHAVLASRLGATVSGRRNVERTSQGNGCWIFRRPSHSLRSRDRGGWTTHWMGFGRHETAVPFIATGFVGQHGCRWPVHVHGCARAGHVPTWGHPRVPPTGTGRRCHSPRRR
jgi:hypothetical protein